MFIRISSMTEAQVFQLLQEADLGSSYQVGSHTDSYQGIAVNGTTLEPFGYQYRWHSVQNTDHEDRNIDPINRLPDVSEILTATIIDTHHRYGGNSRDRARIQIFARSVSYQGYIQKALEARISGDQEEERRMLGWSKANSTNKLFLVIDIGEVEGWRPVSKGQATDVSLMWAIWSAQKNVKVEVDLNIDSSVFRDLKNGFSSGNDPRYYHNNRAHFEKLEPKNAQHWFQEEVKAAGSLRDTLKASALLINHSWPEGGIEHAFGYVKEDLFKAFQVLWTALPLGNFLSNLGLK